MKPFFLLSLLLLAALATASSTSPPTYSSEQQPLSSSQSPSTVPAFPLAQPGDNQTCHLDLSAELFGGVSDACGRGVLDRGRCCPVLAAWLFAAHARSALQIRSPPLSPDADDLPMMPDDSQKCVDSLQSSLASRDIQLPRPNSTCDAVLCFCGIRLHQIGSLSCPAAFNVTAGNRNATPTAAVTDLERNCRNSTYAGCTRCLDSLQKVKGKGPKGSTDRAAKMFSRDCQLMGLTWLLAKNKTLYIPTVSAVLRALLYSTHPPAQQHYKCSPDQENMPLAVDSLQFQKPDSSSPSFALGFSLYALSPLLFFLCFLS